MESLVDTEIQSPNSPARSKSLYYVIPAQFTEYIKTNYCEGFRSDITIPFYFSLLWRRRWNYLVKWHGLCKLFIYSSVRNCTCKRKRTLFSCTVLWCPEWVDKISLDFHSCIVHLDNIKVFCLPTDAQYSCFKRILKILHVSVQSPSSGSLLFELAKATPPNQLQRCILTDYFNNYNFSKLK
jgi:hypothetical protein